MKRTGNANNKFNNRILLLSLLVQLLFIAASSPVYGVFDRVSAYDALIRQSIFLSHKCSQMGYYLMTLNDKLPEAEIESGRYIIFNITRETGFTGFYHIIFLSAFGLSVIILFFGHVIIRNSRSKAPVERKMGGHDPPVRLSFA